MLVGLVTRYTSLYSIPHCECCGVLLEYRRLGVFVKAGEDIDVLVLWQKTCYVFVEREEPLLYALHCGNSGHELRTRSYPHHRVRRQRCIMPILVQCHRPKGLDILEAVYFMLVLHIAIQDT